MNAKLSDARIASARASLGAVVEDISRAFVERDDVVLGMMLAAIAGEHVLLLGPPGTGKSDLAMSFSRALGARSFSYLVGAYTSPDELLGSFSLKKLADDDVMQRKTAGRLPEADVAFLDELFKANSKMLNTLLPVFNERVLYDADDTGRVVAKLLPLRLIVAASNELPADDDETLAAFDDRLLVRFVVDRIEDDEAARALFFGVRHMPTARASLSDLEVLRDAASSLSWSEQASSALLVIRAELHAKKVLVSDRKWRQAIKLASAHAVWCGRDVVSDRDLSVLAHALWKRPEQRSIVDEIIAKHAASWVALVRDTLATIREVHGRLADIQKKKLARADRMVQLAGIMRAVEETITPAVETVKKDAPAEEAAVIEEECKRLADALDSATMLG